MSFARCRTAAFSILLLGLAACAPLPADRSWSSPNFDARRPNFVILHHTSNDNAERALHTLTDPERRVSAHYLIGRDGQRYQLVDEGRRAWHAGESRWGGLSDLNSASIGIELDNNGAEPYPAVQIEALLQLLGELRTRHRIPVANILAHGDVAPGRKADPGTLFPWMELAGKGFGLWCRQVPEAAPASFDPLLGLRALGYDLRQPQAAIAAFRRHFLAEDNAAPLVARDAALIHCLLEALGQGEEGQP